MDSMVGVRFKVIKLDAFDLILGIRKKDIGTIVSYYHSDYGALVKLDKSPNDTYFMTYSQIALIKEEKV